MGIGSSCLRRFLPYKRQATLISSVTGYWGAWPIPGTSPKQLAAGNYIGIEKYVDADQKFTSLGPVEKFAESSRYIETDANSIWVSHPYRGVYRISFVPTGVSCAGLFVMAGTPVSYEDISLFSSTIFSPILSLTGSSAAYPSLKIVSISVTIQPA